MRRSSPATPVPDASRASAARRIWPRRWPPSARARRRGSSVLLLDAGRPVQGSLFLHRLAWRGGTGGDANALGTDAMAVGKPRVRQRPATLARFVRARASRSVGQRRRRRRARLAGLLSHSCVEKAGAPPSAFGRPRGYVAVGSSPGPAVASRHPVGADGGGGGARADGALLVLALSHLGVGAMPASPGRVGGGMRSSAGIRTACSPTASRTPAGRRPVLEGPRPAVVVQRPAMAAISAARPGRGGGRRVWPSWRGLPTCRARPCHEEARVAAIVAGYAGQLDAVRRRGRRPDAAPIDVTGCRIGSARSAISCRGDAGERQAPTPRS